MKRSYLAWGLAAAVLLLGPVGLRVMSWEWTHKPSAHAGQASAGADLFKHEWQRNDPLSKGGDGLGPIFNARSCVACHFQGGMGGGGGLEHNVTTFVAHSRDGRTEPKSGVLHADAWSEEYRETLRHLDSNLPPLSKVTLTQINFPQRFGGGIRKEFGPLDANVQVVVDEPIVPVPFPPGQPVPAPVQNVPPHMQNQPLMSDIVQLSQRNTPALFGAGLIDSISDRAILLNEREQKMKFGVTSHNSTTLPVGRAHRLADGSIGRFGWKGQTARLKDFVEAACANELGLSNPTNAQPVSMARLSYKSQGLDLTQSQCDDITAFVASLPKPVENVPAEPKAVMGKAVFSKIGCANCHTPTLGAVDGIYSDLLLHRMGNTLEGSGDSYGGQRSRSPGESIAANDPLPDEWRTPPLWGVANSAPYLHDGRAATLQEAILMHDGQGGASAQAFRALSIDEQGQVLAFLRSLKAPQ